MEHSIKRGITIYSWNRQVEAGVLTWDDCVKAAVKMGCTGIELLGQLYFRNCPEVLDEDVESWKELMWKYGTKTIAHDFFVDMTMYNHRRLTVREGVDIVRRHALFAKKIDCPIMRLGGTVPPEIFRESLPILEDLDIKMGLEIHSGSSSFSLPNVQNVIEIIRESKSPYIGIVPDMSMFVKKIGTRAISRAINSGVDEKFVYEVADFYTKVDNVEFRKFCNDTIDKSDDESIKTFLGGLRRTEYYDPNILLEHMPYIIHCHGKFYEMDDDNMETTIDYPGILNALKEGGYDGYISAEYEGSPINGDIFEPFRRYQKMLDKYLGKYPEDNYPEWPYSRPVEGGGSMFGVSQAAVPGTLKNHYEGDECTGFELEVKNFYYRGVPLALFESAYVEIDGEVYGPESMLVAIDGEVFKFEDMRDVTLHYWNKGYNAKLIIAKPGGLSAGEHKVSANVSVRAYYMREGISVYMGDQTIRFAEPLKMTV
jgi:sugar phosphate isomerase/epimerase